MTDMVERATRAIYERSPEGKWVTQPIKLKYKDGSPVTETVFVPHPWGYEGNVSIQYRKNCTADARAALKAAFQITDEDARAFFGDENADVESDLDSVSMRALNEAMQAISDAALKE